MPSLLVPERLPQPYFLNDVDKSKKPVLSHDVFVPDGSLNKASTSSSAPPALPPQPILDKQGKPLTKRQIIEVSLSKLRICRVDVIN